MANIRYPKKAGKSRRFFTTNPTVPFVHNFGRLTPKKIIQIDGVPFPNPSRFTVYLQRGGDSEPDEIAMCFDARFKFNADNFVVVRNHKQGSWGLEERDISFFPFTQSTPFNVIILFETNGFKVAVNNNHFLEFKHRFYPMDRIDTLRIDGDVQLLQVVIQ